MNYPPVKNAFDIQDYYSNIQKYFNSPEFKQGQSQSFSHENKMPTAETIPTNSYGITPFETTSVEAIDLGSPEVKNKKSFNFGGVANKVGGAALQAAPGVFAAMSQDLEDVDTYAEFKNKANQGTMQMTASGAQAGLQVGGIWGGLIGGAAGFVGGKAKEITGRDGAITNLDNNILEKEEDINEERLQLYQDMDTEDRIKATKQLMSDQFYLQNKGNTERMYTDMDTDQLKSRLNFVNDSNGYYNI